MDEILKKLKAVYEEALQKLSQLNAKLTEVKNKEDKLAGLIADNESRAKGLDEKESSLNEKEKKQVRVDNLLEREAKLDADQKELRRAQDVLKDEQAKHSEKVKNETSELERQRTKLSTAQQALNEEKSSYKDKMKKQIIDDFVKSKLSS